MKKFEIGVNDAGQRLDKFLLKTAPGLPKGMLFKALRKRNIKKNGKRCEAKEQLQLGDVLELYLPDDVFAQKPHSSAPSSAPPPSVVYEDESLLIVDKPVGLKSQPDNPGEDSLIGRVLYYLFEKGAYNPEAEQSFRPALCNRIDRNTRGLVVAAKTAAALRTVNQWIRDGRIRKTYLCRVEGVPASKHAVLTGWWTKDALANKVSISREKRTGAKMVRTEYRTLSSDGGTSLLEVVLHTGRSHQIRAHLASIGNPLAGDKKYGGHGGGGQQLAAVALTFDAGNEACMQGVSGKTIRLENPDL